MVTSLFLAAVCLSSVQSAAAYSAARGRGAGGIATRSAASRRVVVASTTYDEADAMVDDTDAPMKSQYSDERRAPRAPRAGRLADTWLVLPDERPEVSSFPISPATIEMLNKRGIMNFTPIQTGAFTPIMEGRDILARSRTGTGKTLAFALPIVESIGKSNAGRPKPCQPLCIVLVPTRELAKQVASEFELIAATHRLSVVSVYGGAPMGPQVREMRAGVHIVVGTPGRILDHINEGTIDLQSVRHAVLDEADEMLDMGFADDVAAIMDGAPPAGSRQMLLFSATTPPFIQKLVRQHMRDELQLDAVGSNDGPKTSTTVQHFAVLAPERNEHRPAVLRDVLTVHGRGAKRVIVFTETKRDCDELVTGRQLGTLSAAALHGDVQQAQRETTMKNFREGKFTVLVATDVAARGIDVSGVDLVISYHVPGSVESYVHRSGRTGRAGASGKSIILYNEGRYGLCARIEKECQFKFVRIGPPAPEAVIAAAAINLPSLIKAVDPEVIPLFAATARKIMQEAADDSSLETQLAAALACVAGITSFEARSLLTGRPHMRTLQLKAPARMGPVNVGAVVASIRELGGAVMADMVGKVRLCEDTSLAVFDLPASVAAELLEKIGAVTTVANVVAEPGADWNAAAGAVAAAAAATAAADVDEPTLSVCTELPVLTQRDARGGEGRSFGGGARSFGGGGRSFGGDRGGGGGGRFGGGGGGGRSFGSSGGRDGGRPRFGGDRDGPRSFGGERRTFGGGGGGGGGFERRGPPRDAEGGAPGGFERRGPPRDAEGGGGGGGFERRGPPRSEGGGSRFGGGEGGGGFERRGPPRDGASRGWSSSAPRGDGAGDGGFERRGPPRDGAAPRSPGGGGRSWD